MTSLGPFRIQSLRGIWLTLYACVQGRQARLFERERRATLLAVSPVLVPGTWIADRRADGSALEIRTPQAPGDNGVRPVLSCSMISVQGRAARRCSVSR
jgi:hypothetical protein